MKGKIRFFCFVSLEEGLCPLFNKILWIAALHKVLFKFCNGFFTNSRGPSSETQGRLAGAKGNKSGKEMKRRRFTSKAERAPGN